MSREKQIEEMAKDLDACPYLAESIGTDKHEGDIKIAEYLVYKKGYRKQEWISVEDRLPEDEIPVLVFTAKGKYYVGYYYKAVTSPTFTGFYADSCRRDVTHWMPLPEPPMMKGNEKE